MSQRQPRARHAVLCGQPGTTPPPLRLQCRHAARCRGAEGCRATGEPRCTALQGCPPGGCQPRCIPGRHACQQACCFPGSMHAAAPTCTAASSPAGQCACSWLTTPARPGTLHQGTLPCACRTKEVILPNGNKVTVRYNDTCHFYQPPRAHHCSVNDNCIERFDHHCPWVGTTIGLVSARPPATAAAVSYAASCWHRACLAPDSCCLCNEVLPRLAVTAELTTGAAA